MFDRTAAAFLKELTLGRMNTIPIRDTIQKLNVILKPKFQTAG